jgi:hypothetical protein
MSMHFSNEMELDDAISEEELTSTMVEEVGDTSEDELAGVSMPLEAGSFALLAGVSLDSGGTSALLMGGTSPLLEELASVLSMAEEFVSPPVGALGLLSSQAVSARAKIDAAASPQAVFMNFVFMKPLLFINLQSVSSKRNIQSFFHDVNTFMQQNMDKLLKIT